MTQTFVVVGAGLAAAKAVEELRDRRVRGHGGGVRRRAPPALRAAAPVQGLPPRQRRARDRVRARPRLVRRERRRPAARAAGHRDRPGGPRRAHRATASRPTTSCWSPPARHRGTSRWPTTRALPWPTSAPSRTASGSRRRSPPARGRGDRRRLDRSRDRPRPPATPAPTSPCWSRSTCRCCGCSDPRWPRSSPTCTASTGSTCGSGCRSSASRQRRRPRPSYAWPTATRSRPTCVVVGIGVAPNVALAEAAGLATDNGILVDEHLATSDPDVFAAGDVANARAPGAGPTDPRRALGHRDRAGQDGRARRCSATT